jgi:hypothetical protein
MYINDIHSLVPSITLSLYNIIIIISIIILCFPLFKTPLPYVLKGIIEGGYKNIHILVTLLSTPLIGAP